MRLLLISLTILGLSLFLLQSLAMAVQCPNFSFTKPRRLPRRRIRPSKAAFRAAVAHLDFINRRAGKFLVPAIVELQDDENISPEDEYRMVNDAAQ